MMFSPTMGVPRGERPREADPNMGRRQQMLAQLLQGGAMPQQTQANPMAGMAGGLQQAFQRPDVQKWLMALFPRGGMGTAPVPQVMQEPLPPIQPAPFSGG